MEKQRDKAAKRAQRKVTPLDGPLPEGFEFEELPGETGEDSTGEPNGEPTGESAGEPNGEPGREPESKPAAEPIRRE
jgi:hypothetical protein